MSTDPNADYVFGVSWYGNNASIAQTGYEFTREDASRVAKEGAEATDFWAWAAEQPFTVDELTDGANLPVVRADVETEEQVSEFTAWEAEQAEQIDSSGDPRYPNGQCAACGWGLNANNTCPNPDCTQNSSVPR